MREERTKENTGLRQHCQEKMSLERKLGKPDWKQWIPFFGIYQLEKDLSKNNPTIIDEEYGNKMLIEAMAVHIGSVLAVGAGIIYSLINYIKSNSLAF